MRNIVFSYLLLPLFAGLSLTANAASIPQAANAPLTAQQAGASEGSPKIDLNSADAQTLQKHLEGIGKAKAEAIVAHREASGPFASVDELLEVKGIGSTLLERNRDKMRVE
ncbi:MAG: helix-hairpin-helix domain-containing protein [Paucimonas sp.]|jgi:competence protein ComEA|nr:helix-hairpin-helix domain-containing protein [Paucimonas sp.]